MKRYSPILSVVFGLALCAAPAADVSFYGIGKSQQFTQTVSSAPALLVSNAFRFTAFVIPATNGVVTNATVKPPGSTNRTLAEASGFFEYDDAFNTQAALDAAYPAGSPFSTSYTLTMATVNDGIHSQSLSFFSMSYPTTPQISNLAAGQSIDTTVDFTLRWNSLGGSSLDIVQLLIFDAASNVVFATPAPFTSGALNGASTEAIIPANSLPVDSLLTGHVSVARPGLPNTSYSGATGLPLLVKDTEFGLVTRGAPSRPDLTALGLFNGLFTLRLEGETNRTYRIEGSSDFTNWPAIFATNSFTGTFDWSDPDTTNFIFRAYRAKVGQ